MINKGIIVNTCIFVGPTSETCLHQVSNTYNSLFLSFFFLLSPGAFSLSLSPSFSFSQQQSSKPTFLHKFFTPFSLVLSLLFPSAPEEQQYPGKALHLKENPKTQQL